MATIFPMFLAFPILVWPYGDTGIVLADILCVFGFFVFLKRLLIVESIFLILAILLGLVSCATYMVILGDINFRPFGSLVFFFKPYFAYFVPFTYVFNKHDADSFFENFSKYSIIVCGSVIVSVVLFYGFIFRADSYLNGSFFGLPIFGTYGVNSLAVFYAMCAFAAIYPMTVLSDIGAKIVYFVPSIGFAFLSIMSLSREAVLGLIVMWAVLLFLYIRVRPILAASSLLVVSATVALSFPAITESEMLAAKIDQISEGLARGDWDHVSSGRLSLYSAALRELTDRPLVGVGFRGYGENAPELRQFETLDGLSPHNQYLTAAWKMGLVGAVAYFVMIFAMLSRAFIGLEKRRRYWLLGFTIGVLLIFCNLWDALIVPNVAALFFYILGVFAAAGRSKDVLPPINDRLSR